MRLIRFVGKCVAVAFLLLVARRRRLQKLRKRVELLSIALQAEQDRNKYLTEQLDGYRDAFESIQSGYRLLFAANTADIAQLTIPKKDH